MSSCDLPEDFHYDQVPQDGPDGTSGAELSQQQLEAWLKRFKDAVQDCITDPVTALTARYHTRHVMGVVNFGNPLSSVVLNIDNFSNNANSLPSNTWRIPIDRRVLAFSVAMRATTFTSPPPNTPPDNWELVIFKNGVEVGTAPIILATNPAFGVACEEWDGAVSDLTFEPCDVWHMIARGGSDIADLNALGLQVETGWLDLEP